MTDIIYIYIYTSCGPVVAVARTLHASLRSALGPAAFGAPPEPRYRLTDQSHSAHLLMT